MKAATIHQIKKELTHKNADELLKLCLRLGKFKKDNKELLTYLLFEADDEEAYIELMKNDIEDQLNAINSNSLYYVKKGLRKLIRNMDKGLRYSGQKETELAVRIFLCQKIQERGIPYDSIRAFMTIYDSQIKKIKAALSKLHEDLQYEYLEDVKGVER